jgi:hypothetical protein
MLLLLLIYERRVNGKGTAVCVLGRPSKGRMAAIVLVSSVLLGLAGALWPPLLLIGLGVLVVLAAILLPGSVVLAWRARRQRAALKSYGPPRGAVMVWSVASSTKGAGADLMAELAAEADAKAWPLALDAANEDLAGYYGRFGFEPLGEPVAMPWGESVVRMGRRSQPQPRDGMRRR